MKPRSEEGILRLIVEKAIDLMVCDGGSVYLVHNEKELFFELAINRSIRFKSARRSLPVGETSLAAHVFRTGQSLNVPDAYAIDPGSPFRIDHSFDRENEYRTRSVLMQPLMSSKGERFGVLQLVNRKRSRDERWPSGDPSGVLQMPAFSPEDERLLASFAFLASASIENSKLYNHIERLFEGFIKASVSLIEKRDPPTRGHSERVAILCVDLADKAGKATHGPLKDTRLSTEQLEELRYAALLHDFGKVGVREDVLLKEEKLPAALKQAIRHRLDSGKSMQEVALLKRLLSDLVASGRAPTELDLKRVEREIETNGEQVKQWWNTICDLSKPTVLDEDKSARLEKLVKAEIPCPVHGKVPVIDTEQAKLLSIKRGSLSLEERLEIESHVTQTYQFLMQIPWSAKFSRLAEIAYAHHEKLDGTGYPRKLLAPQIPVQSRIMTICDIYDALVASDRPYKRAVPIEKALDILKSEAAAGKLDASLLEIFIAAKIFENADFLRLNVAGSRKAA